MADDGILKLRVGNHGTTVSPLTKVVFTGLDKLTISDVITSQGTFEGDTWDVGNLWRSQTANIEFVITGADEEIVTIVGTISGRNPDYVEENNTVTVIWEGGTISADFRVTTSGDNRITTNGDFRIRNRGN